MTTDEQESALDADTAELPPVPVRQDRAVIAAVVAAVLLLGVLGAFFWFRTADLGAVGTTAVRPANVTSAVPVLPPASPPPVAVTSVRPSLQTTTKRMPVRSPSAPSATSSNNNGQNGQNNGQNGGNDGNNGNDGNGNGNGGNGNGGQGNDGNGDGGNGDLFPGGF